MHSTNNDVHRRATRGHQRPQTVVKAPLYWRDVSAELLTLFFRCSVPGMQDFNYLHTNCFEVTVEVGCDPFPPQEELHQAWQENYQALLTFMEAVGSCLSLEWVFCFFFMVIYFFLFFLCLAFLFRCIAASKALWWMGRETQSKEPMCRSEESDTTSPQVKTPV